MTRWTIEYEGESFARFYSSLGEYEQAVVTAAIEHVLAVHGIDICNGEWGKPLSGGLYEFRVRKSFHSIFTEANATPPSDLVSVDRMVLIRVFCTFHGDKIVLLYSGYDKKKDPSDKRQQREIAKARKIHEQWKRAQRTQHKQP
ncbi:hypothetical protein [Cryobacterium levicorallinum]|uniref:Type II toxin-antitoxin system RelE/ParE family toxin n=2 Tax=Cryobacterium levicorallinum TaxID=995038 RepID=A0ABY1EAF9_9MICO|nr:hypothetical protein [Cryobacterium levicorallinum]GEP27621.1 hypothetical protein CLE01_22190 [Cryobacterium levicorallinum]SFH27346.1 hypothetical protein SAMN05216274_102236 [Cryobacterium levicorallinum]